MPHNATDRPVCIDRRHECNEITKVVLLCSANGTLLIVSLTVQRIQSDPQFDELHGRWRLGLRRPHQPRQRAPNPVAQGLVFSRRLTNKCGGRIASCRPPRPPQSLVQSTGALRRKLPRVVQVRLTDKLVDIHVATSTETTTVLVEHEADRDLSDRGSGLICSLRACGRAKEARARCFARGRPPLGLPRSRILPRRRPRPLWREARRERPPGRAPADHKRCSVAMTPATRRPRTDLQTAGPSTQHSSCRPAPALDVKQ